MVKVWKGFVVPSVSERAQVPVILWVVGLLVTLVEFVEILIGVSAQMEQVEWESIVMMEELVVVEMPAELVLVGLLKAVGLVMVAFDLVLIVLELIVTLIGLMLVEELVELELAVVLGDLVPVEVRDGVLSEVEMRMESVGQH